MKRRSQREPLMKMSTKEKRDNSYLHLVYILLKIAPYAIEMYIDRIYPGGFICALRDKVDFLMEKASPEQRKILSQLYSSSKHHIPFYDEIVHTTELDGCILDHMISRCMLTMEDRAEVTQFSRQSERNKKLLDILSDRSSNMYIDCIAALRTAEPNYTDLVQRMERMDLETTSIYEPKIDMGSNILGEHTVRIQRNYDKLVHDMASTAHIIDQLVSDGILNPDDSVEILSSIVPSEMNRRLIGKIRDKNQYDKLIAALREDSVNAKLADDIEHTDVTEHDLELLHSKKVFQSTQWRTELDIDLMILLATEAAGVKLPETKSVVNVESIERQLYHLKSCTHRIIHSTEDDIENSQCTEMIDLITDILVQIGGTCIEEECNIVSRLSTAQLKMAQNELFTLKDKIERVNMKTDIAEIKSEQNEAIPRNIRDQIKQKLEKWENDDKNFVSTKASRHILNCLKKNSCVTVTGGSGVGKTTAVRHVALLMRDKGFDIVPITTPRDIRDFYTNGKPTIFVVDNLCGNYTAKQQQLEDWRQFLDDISNVLKDYVCKLIVSCRLQVFKDGKLASLSIFKNCECNLSSEELSLTSLEKQTIAKGLSQEIDDEVIAKLSKYEFFPLLCRLYQGKEDLDIRKYLTNPFHIYKDELDNMFNEGDDGKCKYCALALVIIFNNNLKETYLTGKVQCIQRAIEETCEACCLNKGISKLQLKAELDTLEGTYVTKENGIYHTIHDKLFDFMAYYFGQQMIQCFIDNGDSALIGERCLWKTAELTTNTPSNNCNESNAATDIKGFEESENRFTTLFSDDLLQMYIERMIKDWSKGEVANVFCNRNMESPLFREKMLTHLNEIELSIQHELSYKTDKITEGTALYYTCYHDDTKMLVWLLNHNDDITKCDNCGLSPLHAASQNGHIDIVNVILSHLPVVEESENRIRPRSCMTCCFRPAQKRKTLSSKSRYVDAYDNSGCTPFYKACWNGHLEVVCKLLEFKVDVNKCKHDGTSPLYIACEGGHLPIVSKLLEYKADVNKCIGDVISPLHVACQKGYLNVVCKLLEYKSDVNQRKNDTTSPLYIACDEGHLQVVCKLLEFNADINISHVDGATPLYIACKNDHLQIVSKLLECKADINRTDNHGFSPLYVACRNGNVDIVCTLLEHRADINLSNNNGVSPLYIACLTGYLQVVCTLLENNAEVNLANYNGVSPLYIACQKGHLQIVCKLLDYNADKNKCKFNNTSPLCIASQKNHIHIISKLLEANVQVNHYNNSGASPLFIGCQKGHYKVVCKLLDYNADVNLCNNEGVSPLSIACQEGHLRVVCRLLKTNANVNSSDLDGFSPLHVACQDDHPQIVCKLLGNHADVNQGLHDGTSPLYLACQEGHVHIVCKLLENKADVNQCNAYGVSPMSIACQEGHLAVVCKMLGYVNNVDIDKVDLDGFSPLHVACQEGYSQIVSKLLEHNGDVNKCNNDGMSPLYLACQEGHLQVVCTLLETGADVNLCNKDGISPLSIACYEGHYGVICKLMDFKADINKTNQEGFSPLHVACHENNLEIASKLIENNADINQCSYNGVSPLYIACQNGNLPVVCKLLEHNVDVNKCDDDGTSALLAACLGSKSKKINTPLNILWRNDYDDHNRDDCRKDHTEILNVLIERKADVNKQGNDSCTPLLWACTTGDSEIVTILMNSAADVSKCLVGDQSILKEFDWFGIIMETAKPEVKQYALKITKEQFYNTIGGCSPLHMASFMGHVNLIKVFLDRQQDVNVCKGDGTTPLYIACEVGHTDLVHLLLENKANPDIYRKDGKSPFVAATSNMHTAITTLLRNHKSSS